MTKKKNILSGIGVSWRRDWVADWITAWRFNRRDAKALDGE